MSQDPSMSFQKASELLEQINTNESQRPGWDEPSTAIESGRKGLGKLPEFVKLEQMARTTWPQLVSNIQTVAPSRMSKTVLFVALQSLPPDDYLQFLDQAVGLAEGKTIDKQLFKWALFPADKNVRGVLDYNYDKPVVRDILQKVRVLYADDPNMVKYCDTALSGEAKKNAEAYFIDNPDEPRPGPALNKGAPTSPKSKISKSIIQQTSQATPIQSLPTLTPQASAPVVEKKSTLWPWLIGIIVLALIVIGLLVWKSRS